jgi:pentapeptide repeat protein
VTRGLAPSERSGSSRGDPLRADCAQCLGLCCVAPAFAVSVDFAVDKPAGCACPNLQPDFSCGIHAHLRQRGFRGCTVYDCFGAGQQVCQITLRGNDWRRDPDTKQHMLDVFAVMRHLHELLWYLREALSWPSASRLHRELGRAWEVTTEMTGQPADVLLDLDIAAHRQGVAALLRRASALVRADVPGSPREHSGADLVGTDLAGADLRGAELRSTSLIGADLSTADLTRADLIGADLRDADLRGADLTGALFLTQSQVDAARGDAGTVLPPSLIRPAHWSAEGIDRQNARNEHG